MVSLPAGRLRVADEGLARALRQVVERPDLSKALACLVCLLFVFLSFPILLLGAKKIAFLSYTFFHSAKRREDPILHGLHLCRCPSRRRIGTLEEQTRRTGDDEIEGHSPADGGMSDL